MFARLRPNLFAPSKNVIAHMFPRAAAIDEETQPSKGERAWFDQKFELLLKRLRFLNRDLVLHSDMKPRAMLILPCEEPMTMIGNHIAQAQHRVAFQPDRSALAQRHYAFNLRIDGCIFARHSPAYLADFTAILRRQRVKKRDMRLEKIALRRKVAIAQAGGPAVQILGQKRG